MIQALALAVFVTTGGALATYIYDEGASLGARLCTGACIGLAALGLIGFVLASLLGLTPFSIGLATLATAAPFGLLLDPTYRPRIQADVTAAYHKIRHAVSHRDPANIAYFAYYAVAAILFWLIFDRAMIQRPDGIYTGVLNNFGDLPFHLSVITSFAYGQNFPPEDPTFAGVRFTYPFLTDFISAVFLRCGASLRNSMFIENMFLAVAFVGVLHRWAWEMLRDRIAAVLTPLLVLLNGGFGWLLLFTAAGKSEQGLIGVLTHLPASFTVIPETTWRWGNAISSLLVPQRGILLGFPLAVIVFTQWWLAAREGTEGETGRKEKTDAGTGRHGNTGKTKPENGEFGKQRAGTKKSRKEQRLNVGSDTNHLVVPVSRRRRFPASFLAAPSPTARMIAAGVVAGLLPLVHAHSFVVVAVVGGCLALGYYWRAWLAVVLSAVLVRIIVGLAMAGPLSETTVEVPFAGVAIALVVAVFLVLPRAHWKLWFAFFATALVIAVPQMFWSTRGSAVNAASFFAWEFGWDHGQENPVWFWFTNTGLFVPLLICAILWRGKDYLVSRRLLLFYLPFTLCFVVPNLVKLAPWIWDNIKVLFYWWLASAPLVALLLSRMWRNGSTQRALAVSLFACLTLAGALDVASIVMRSGEFQLFDPYGVQFAEVVKQQTQPRSLVMHAPVHNTPVFLSGRRSLMGYPGHIWTHGLDFGPRESEIKRIYSGAPDAEMLLAKYGVDYAVVGPLERLVLSVNDQFFSRFNKVGEAGEYRLYKIKQP